MKTITTTKDISAEQLTIAYYQAYARLATSKNTQDNYKYALIAYQKFNSNNTAITFNGVKAMVEGLQAENKSPDTINQYIGRLAKILNWSVKVGICEKNFLDPEIFPRLKTVAKLHKNVTDEMDFDELLKTVENQRDRAIFVLMGVAGMRKSEVIELNKDDISRLDDGSYKILVRNPKNGKQRWSILSSDYANELEKHLETVDKIVFTADQTGKRLYIKSIDYIVKKYGKWSPHKLRHRVAEVLYQSGASIDDIAEVLGNTTSVCASVYKGIDISRQTNTSNLLKRNKTT